MVESFRESMKIAFAVSFFDFRNDVRRVIAEVARHHQVVVLGRTEHMASIQKHVPAGVEFRQIAEKKRTIWNTIWERLYLLMRRIPRSRSNFFLMELFKASNQPTAKSKSLAMSLLRWMQRLPKIISYDFYLDRLRYQSLTELDDIDLVICFTAIVEDYLLARLIREQKPVRVYVYSWDHPCKHTCFSQRVQYACWSEGIREDIVSLQNIPSGQIAVTGASQFGYIHAYRQTDSLPVSHPFRYVYFGCAIGIPELVPDELRLVATLAQSLQAVQPGWKLLVRPYPVLSDWTPYDELRGLPNVVFDDTFRTQDASVQEEAILQKYATIERAEAFFHLGTTMGLEACFTATPSFVLDFGYTTREGLSLYNFIHQYQNDRHLINLAPQNAIRSEENLREVLGHLAAPAFKDLNRAVQKKYTLKSFEAFAGDLIGQAGAFSIGVSDTKIR
jgi:hypothetical protein